MMPAEGFGPSGPPPPLRNPAADNGIIRGDERRRTAVRADHDPDQPLLREGALGARARRRRLPGARPPAARPLARGAACGRREDGAGARLRRSGAGGLGGRSSPRPTPARRRGDGCTRTIPAAAAEVRELEREFDARLGPHGRLWMYDAPAGAARDRDRVRVHRRSGLGAPRPSARLSAGHPGDRPLSGHHAGGGRSSPRPRCGPSSTRWPKRLADGRPYLCGDRFTAADLTFAALGGVGADAARVRRAASPARGAAGRRWRRWFGSSARTPPAPTRWRCSATERR